MKRIIAVLIAGIMLCIIPCAAVTNGDEDISQYVHIKYAMYDGAELFGDVEIPDGVFFVRASFFLAKDEAVILIIPISREGLFQIDIAGNFVYIAIGIVDSPCAIVPGCGTVYKTAVVSMI